MNFDVKNITIFHWVNKASLNYWENTHMHYGGFMRVILMIGVVKFFAKIYMHIVV